MTVDLSYKHSELSEAIIGVFYEVYNELGYGFLESVYREAIRLVLTQAALRQLPEFLYRFVSEELLWEYFEPI